MPDPNNTDRIERNKNQEPQPALLQARISRATAHPNLMHPYPPQLRQQTGAGAHSKMPLTKTPLDLGEEPYTHDPKPKKIGEKHIYNGISKSYETYAIYGLGGNAEELKELLFPEGDSIPYFYEDSDYNPSRLGLTSAAHPSEQNIDGTYSFSDEQNKRYYINEYRKSVSKLSEEQLKALRLWTIINEKRFDIYENLDPIVEDTDQTKEISGSRINLKLQFNDDLTESEEKYVLDLESALDLLPDELPAPKLMRTDGYAIEDGKEVWEQKIKVGDYVSNANSFMSSTSSSYYANKFLVEHMKDDTPEDTTAPVFLKIESVNSDTIALSGKPLIHGITSNHLEEQEYLSPPTSVFKVKAIAKAEKIASEKEKQLSEDLSNLSLPDDDGYSEDTCRTRFAAKLIDVSKYFTELPKEIKQIHTGNKLIRKDPEEKDPSQFLLTPGVQQQLSLSNPRQSMAGTSMSFFQYPVHHPLLTRTDNQQSEESKQESESTALLPN